MQELSTIELKTELPEKWTTVFISYSRKDSEIVRELASALETQGIGILIDVEDILPIEEWKARIKNLIEQSDATVFCISQDSLLSDECKEEIDYSRDLGKRIAPVLIDAGVKSVPGAISKYNYIFCLEKSAVPRASRLLAAALKKNIAWIREGTRLSDLALRWDRSGRPSDQLLVGQELEFAEGWLSNQPPEEQLPHPTTVEYIRESRRIEMFRRRRRTIQKVSFWTLGILLLASGAVAVWFNLSHISLLTKSLADSVWSRTLSRTQERALAPGNSFAECFCCPPMVVIPKGTFVMGWGTSEGGDGHETEQPSHPVHIDYNLAVSKYEITFDEWDACVLAGACPAQRIDFGWGRGLHPIVYISWDEAVIYTKWLSDRTGKQYRLLSESEWEFAARAGKSDILPLHHDDVDPKANCEGCGSRWDGTAPVGRFPANDFGLHDMLGNVWEWVLDCDYGNYKQVPADGSPKLGSENCGRVARGLSFTNNPEQLHPAYRGLNIEVDKRKDIGFRVGRVINP